MVSIYRRHQQADMDFKRHDLRKQFKALLQAADDSHLEYEEKHGDAGSAYVHLVTEDEQRAKKKLLEYMKEHMPDVTEDERKAIVRKVDEWCIDMQPGHRFSTTDPEEGCCVDSWALEEVENQHEVKRFAEELDCEESEVRGMARAEEKEGDFCIRCSDRDEFDTFLTYQCTDAVWCAVVPREWINDQLEEIRQEFAEKRAELEAEQAERDIAHCIETGHHLTSCDDDGYCNYCGYQD